jgi:hypothetical protein
MYRSAFLHQPDRPDFRCTDSANFKARLEDEIPINPELHNEVAIDTCFENLSSAVLKALAASTPKNQPHEYLRFPIPAGIQDEICLNKQLQGQLQVTRDPALRAYVNRLQR